MQFYFRIFFICAHCTIPQTHFPHSAMVVKLYIEKCSVRLLLMEARCFISNAQEITLIKYTNSPFAHILQTCFKADYDKIILSHWLCKQLQENRHTHTCMRDRLNDGFYSSVNTEIQSPSCFYAQIEQK